jgi:hypothetical protein
MPRVFISYRHLDSIDITARLWDHLKARFGEPNVFLDYKRMTGGDDFLEVIDRAVDSSNILLSIIGPKWKGLRGPNHLSRILDSGDVVRRELERAQRKNVPILPILVGGASYLSEGELPKSLKKLARKHALKLRSGHDFEDDLRRIIECIERLTNNHSENRSFLGRSISLPFSPPLSSPISKSRSITLATLRTGAVAGLPYMGFRVVQLLITTDVQSLPSLTLLDVTTLIVALIGVILLVISWLRLRLVALWARRRQEVALSDLAELILARLETPGLLSATSVRGLAVNIEQKHRCPIITDKLIAEAIRSAAIKTEYTHHGKELEHRIRLLNKLLLSIDENASAMASIAVVDRLGAYIQSQPILIGALLLLILVIVLPQFFVTSEWSSSILSTVAIVTVIAFLLWLSIERAINYWCQPQDAARSLKRTKHVRPRLLTDFFLVASSSRALWADLFWNNLWGPMLWENIMFLWRSERQLAAMHEFRFDVAQELWKELKKVDIELERSRDQDVVDRTILEQRFQELVRRLWIITGDPQFREIEKRGIIIREDRESGIVGLL